MESKRTNPNYVAKYQNSTQAPIMGRVNRNMVNIVKERRTKVSSTRILIRLTKIPFGTRIRQIKDKLISLSFPPLHIMWNAPRQSGILVYSRKQYPKKELEELMDRLKILPYPAELLSPLERPVTQDQNGNMSSTSTTTKTGRHPRYRELKHPRSPSAKDGNQPERKVLKLSRNQALHQAVAARTPSDDEMIQDFSQMSLDDFPPLTKRGRKNC